MQTKRWKDWIFGREQSINFLNLFDMKTKFYNKNGDLSLYAFCCGYVQSEETERMRKELFMEHSTFHVKVYRLNDGLFSNVIVWNTFDSLTDARKNYKSFKL